jgi:AcrR family transcriptional regulator
MTASTRDELLATATRLFAEKGFYGASIATIARELGLTKQALLHHFGSKEKLYGEVLKGVSGPVLETTREILERTGDPAQRLEAVVLAQYALQARDPDAARLIMRELLDNEQRAQKAGNWYLQPYLELLVDTALAIDHLDLDRARALALVYQLLGAAHYFAVSQPTLGRIFGPDLLRATGEGFEDELRLLVRARVAATPGRLFC